MSKHITQKAVLKFMALAGILGVTYYFAQSIDLTLDAMRTKITSYPAVLSFIVFSCLYAFVTVAPIAGRDVFKMIGATVWGWIPSTLLILLGEMIAAATAFAIARFLGKDFLDRLFKNKLDSSYEKLNKASFRNVLILRILPITPYRYFNFAAGVTDLPLAPYLAGSAIGMFIRTLFFQGLFTFFADQLVENNVTLGQVLIVSLIVTTLMLAAWAPYKWWKNRQ